MSPTKVLRLVALVGLLVLVAIGYILIRNGKMHNHDADHQSAITEQVIKAQLATYPLTNCVVMTDEKLTGEAVNYVYNGRLVRFCCKGCVPKFEKEPGKYLASLDSAASPQAAPGGHTGHQHGH